MQPFDEIMYLGKGQAEIFEKNHIVYMECLVKFRSPRHILNWVYEVLVRRGKLSPIESIDQTGKESLKQFTREINNDRLKHPESLELAKALYCLEYLLNS